MASFTKRRSTAGEQPLKFGWCFGPEGSYCFHQPWGPDETPVDPLDAEGNRIPGFCPGKFVSSNDTKLWKKGTTVYCQCACHGEDQPEAYPGYAAYRAAQGLLEGGYADAEDAEDEEPVLDTRPEPDAEELDGQTDAGDGGVLDDEPDTLAASPDESLEVETKRIKYPSGEVARVEVPGLGRGGKPVTNVNWVAFDKQGVRLGREWSLASAKKLLP